MRNVAIDTQRMQVYSDRFETTLPKKRFQAAMENLRRDTAKAPRPSTPPAWIGYTVLALLFGIFFVLLRQKPEALAPVTTPHYQVESADKLTAPVPPIPEIRRALPTPVQTSGSAPRAQLLHVRPIGTVENDRMPDGRVLTTRYMGELSNAANLPTRGAQLGDMWFTRADGHCWVLAPLGAGSSTVGWIDP